MHTEPPHNPSTDHGAHEDAPHYVRFGGLIAGPTIACAALLVAHPSFGARGGLDASAAWTLAILVWMAIWWVSTAVPLAATSLLPILLLPAIGVGTFADNAAPYANSIIFLFAGGAALGIALDRNGVSARFAGSVMRLAGLSPWRIVAALFISSAFMSAWMSNTATAAVMLPVAVAAAQWAAKVAEPHPDRDRALRNFGIATLLAVAYGASTGGLLTLIGSPPNAIAADWLRSQGKEMGFLGWMRFSAPVVLVFAPLAILTLVKMHPMQGLRLGGAWAMAPAGAIAGATAGATANVHAAHAPLDRAARFTIAVFGVAVVAWLTHPFIPGIPKGVNDATIAVGAALVLLAVPVRVKPWRSALGPSALGALPWSVLILFGGGLSLAEAMQRSGLSLAIGELFAGLSALPAPLVVGIVVGALVFASEVASNTALTATAVPILGALAPALGLPPEQLVIPAAFGASYAFMLPVGTPPNAMAYATGLVPVRSMLRAGMVLNVIGTVTITLLAMLLL